MKIALINSFYPPYTSGGADISVRALAEGLVEHGHEVHVLSISGTASDEYREQNGVHCHYIALSSFGRPFTDPKRKFWERVVWHLSSEFSTANARKFRSRLEEILPDIIQTNNIAGISSAIFRIGKELSVPVVHTLRDYHLICPLATMYKRGHRCVTQCRSCKLMTVRRRSNNRLVSGFVGISNFVLQRHMELGYIGQDDEGPARYVITNGNQGQGTPPVSREAGQPLVMGYIGRLHPIKGVEDLFAALRLVGPSSWRLLIAGSGREDYVGQLKTIVPPGDVTFCGWKAPEDFFSEIDVLVVPSRWDEPLGRVVFEANSYGVPVISARAGGLSELVQEGRTGWLFPPEDHLALADRIRFVLSNSELLSQMRDACLQTAKIHDNSEVSKAYQNAFEAVIARYEG